MSLETTERAWHRPVRDIKERLLEKVSLEPNSGCWLWTGYVAKNGYGRFGIGGAAHWAHRSSYAIFRGPIPPGRDLDHLCRTRSCVNPDHLEPVDRKTNLRRGAGVRLSVALAAKARELLSTSNQAEVARALGVHSSTIAAIRDGRTWT